MYRTQAGAREVAGCVTLGFACHLSRHQEDNIPTFNPYQRARRRQILAPVPDCLSVHRKMWTFNSTRYNTLQNKQYTMPLSFAWQWLYSLWWRKSHLSRAMCPAVSALFSITASNSMQNHFPEVREPCSYIDKSFFLSFQFEDKGGCWIVSVTQSSVK